MNILKMGKEELLSLDQNKINCSLFPNEVVHIAKVLGAFWTYDYESAEDGRVGMHALLKSGLHSDGFFISRILLAPENIRWIISTQMSMRIREVLPMRADTPAWIVGVPDGATRIGEDISRILGSRNADMRKTDGRISLVTQIGPDESILLVEDFCTRGTGFTEAVGVVKGSQPNARILPFNPVIINRGGLEQVSIKEFGSFKVLPVVEWKVKDWEPSECPLCKMGSTPIKPKATDENWYAITTSQL